MKYFLDSILFSYAQIFFSNRRWFGGIVLATTFVVPTMGLVALLGVALANLMAHLLKFDEMKIRSGFYGFNGILFGAAAAFYFEMTPFLLVLVGLFIIITFFVSAVLEHLLASMFNLPGLSLPFVLTLYMFVIFLTNFNTVTPNVLSIASSDLLPLLPDGVNAYFKSLALIMFQPDAVAGVVFAVGLLLLSRVMFILSVVGFSISMLTVGLLFDQPAESITVFVGFNAILTAVALGGNLIIPSRKSFLLTMISSVIIVVLTGFFLKLLAPYHLPVLVLPFNFAVLSVLYSLKFRKEQSELVLLYFLPGTPEENFYYHQNRRARFDRFKAHVPELPFFGEWTVSQGHNGHVTHKQKWRHAWDFVVVDGTGSEHSGSGTATKDYYCYRLPVVAPLEGTVVRVVDGIPDNPIGEINLKANWGNTVILDHGNGLFSSVSHLEPHSIKVAVGDVVKKGTTLGSCGNSGRSPTPHLHFQFQRTDRLGDATLDYPIGQYLERKNASFILHLFDVPQQGMTVQNIGLHKLVKKAFDFKLGDRLSFRCSIGEETFDEQWEVKVDIYNTMFIESSVGATVSVIVVGRVFYLSGFVGNKRSALYHFYLTAVQVPLAYEPNLVWSDEFPLSSVLSSPVRYLSELIVMFQPLLRARAEFRFAERTGESSDFVIRNVITVRGTGVLSFYEQRREGALTIDAEGTLKVFTVRGPGQEEFHALLTPIEVKS